MDFTSLDILEELQTRLAQELEPLVRCAAAVPASSRPSRPLTPLAQRA